MKLCKICNQVIEGSQKYTRCKECRDKEEAKKAEEENVKWGLYKSARDLHPHIHESWFLAYYNEMGCGEELDENRSFSLQLYKCSKESLTDFQKEVKDPYFLKWYTKAVNKQKEKKEAAKHKGVLKTRNFLRSNHRRLLFNCRLTRKEKREFVEIYGCSQEEAWARLGPWGGPDFQLDHICPCAQALNEEELAKLFRIENLRWLHKRDNAKKNCYGSEDAIEMCHRLLGREWINNPEEHYTYTPDTFEW